MGNPGTSEKTSGTPKRAYIHAFPSCGTFQSSINYALTGTSIAVPASVVVASAQAIIEDAYIRAYYELVPKRTISELARAYETRIARQSRKRYIDIDIPMMEDEGDW